MTLQEFISRDIINESFLKDKYKKMKQHVEMMKTTTNEQFRNHGYEADKCYQYIYGYIDAAFAYGKITLEESIELGKELTEEATGYITEEQA